MSVWEKLKNFYSENRKKIVASAAIASVSLFWVASTFANQESVITLRSAVSEEQKSQAYALLAKLMSFVGSFIYTIADLFISFFTQNTVLWTLVILFVFVFVLRRVFMRWKKAL